MNGNRETLSHRILKLKLFIRQIFLFMVVGALGFAVDGGILTLLSRNIGWNLYLSRTVSFTSATFVTWALNRTLTFHGKGASRTRARGRAREYAYYFFIQTIGALINLSVFAWVLWRYPGFQAIPIIPLAAGSSVALFFNFLGARFIIFQSLIGGKKCATTAVQTTWK